MASPRPGSAAPDRLAFLVTGAALTALTDGGLHGGGGVVLGMGLAPFVIAWRTPPAHIEI
ncbi:hypothetical protein ACI8AA_02570 [Geodermatophilus sp. SYSU D01180]